MKDPLKQGLKPQAISVLRFLEMVEVKDPLKQGLNHISNSCCALFGTLVEVKDPLKQGLKHCSCFPPSLPTTG